MTEYLPYGVAATGSTSLFINLRKYATPAEFAVAADWAPAAGDVKVSKDDSAAANITALPTYVTDKGWKFTLTATELECKQLTIRIADSATKAVCDDQISVQTTDDDDSFWPDPNESNPVAANIVAINGGATGVPNMENAFDGTGYAFTASTIGLVDDSITANTFAPESLAPSALAEGFSAAIGADVWSQAMEELTAQPAMADSVLKGLTWLVMLARNTLIDNGTTVTLRNSTDTADVATAAVTDDGTTLTREAFE